MTGEPQKIRVEKVVESEVIKKPIKISWMTVLISQVSAEFPDVNPVDVKNVIYAFTACLERNADKIANSSGVFRADQILMLAEVWKENRITVDEVVLRSLA